MNTLPIPTEYIPKLKGLKTKAPQPFSFLVVYNNLHAAQRAKQMIERLGRKYHDKIVPHVRPLSIECLSSRANFNRAFAEANRADLIIVAISGLGSLPSRLRKWISDCSTLKPLITHFEFGPAVEEAGGVDSPRLNCVKALTTAPDVATPRRAH